MLETKGGIQTIVEVRGCQARLCCAVRWCVQELARAKDAAVAAEDYDEAKRLKAAIERLKVCSMTTALRCSDGVSATGTKPAHVQLCLA
jgi:hypothetical protein